MSTIFFKSRLSKAGGATFLELPKSANARLKLKDTTMVEGIINFFPFRAPLKNHRLKLSKAIVNAASIQADDETKDIATVEITRVGEEPEVRVPADLKKAITANPRAKDQWTKITPMARRDWILSIGVVKLAKTRIGRIEKTIDMLAHGKGRICCFPGINWMTKDRVGKEETWLRLPNSKN